MTFFVLLKLNAHKGRQLSKSLKIVPLGKHP